MPRGNTWVGSLSRARIYVQSVWGYDSNLVRQPGSEQTIIPAAPQNLTATPFSDSQTAGVRLLWDNSSNNEDGFKIQRSTDNGSTWTTLASVGADTTAYVDKNEPAGTACLYRVGSYIGSGDPNYSNTAADPVPAAPTGLAATHDNATNTVSLAWTNHATSADGIEIQWSSDGQNFDIIDEVAASATSYVDTEPPSGSEAKNYYRLVAYRNVPTMQYGIEESTPGNTASDRPVDPPVALDDDHADANVDDTFAPYVMHPNGNLTVSAADGVLANDFDPQGLGISVASHTNPAHGNLTLNADGGFTYVPNSGYSGTDTFTYTITNGVEQSDPANVSITVANRPVITSGDFYQLPASGLLTVGQSGAGSLGVNDTNPDASTVSYHLDTGGGPQHGTLDLNGNGSFTYTPNATFAGIDQFRYYVTDGINQSNVSPVVIGGVSAFPNGINTAANAYSAQKFSNSLLGLRKSLAVSQQMEGAVVSALADFGTAAKALQNIDPTNEQTSGAAIDLAIAKMETVYRDYAQYVVQSTSTVRAAGEYMRSIYFTDSDDFFTLNQVSSLPLTIAGIGPNTSQTNSFRSSIGNFDAGATYMVANNTFSIEAAQATHDALNTSIQAAGLASIAIAGVEVATEQGCAAFAKYAAQQMLSTAGGIAAGAVANQALALAHQFGVSENAIRIGSDSLQLVLLISAARKEALKNKAQCFVAGTEIITDRNAATGVFSQTPIQDIQAGQEVLTRDQYNPDGPLEEQKVLATYRHTVYALEDVVIRNASGTSETIQCTPQHPFYVEGIGWTGSGELVAGEKLSEPDGSEATVVATSSENHPEGVTVYNFQVDQDHTYFVDQGGATVWVHNDCADARELRDNLERDGEVAKPGDRAAHVVPTGNFSNRSIEVQDAIQESQQILEKAGIDLNDAENGFFTQSSTHNGTHTDKYFLQMSEALKRTKGVPSAVISVLDDLKSAADSGFFEKP